MCISIFSLSSGIIRDVSTRFLDGTTILTHNNFKVLQNIEYDKETKQFKFGKISEELKEMFLSFGIKKKDLERDADFAFTLFKKVIVGLGSENKLKNSALDSIEHNFPPPEERERFTSGEEDCAIVLTHIMLEAKELGLDTFLCSYF